MSAQVVLTDMVSRVDISVDSTVYGPLTIVWREFNEPSSIIQWDQAPDWYTTWCINDVRVGGRLEQLMEPRGQGSPFNFCATYTAVEPMRSLTWQTADGQTVRVEFTESEPDRVEVHQTFSADPALNVEEQRDDWQTVLDSFARHVARITS